MKSSQLMTALSTHPETKKVFLGVFASDQLPVSIKNNAALVVNTHPSCMPGQHWCAFYITSECVYYFDSYGQPPFVKSFMTLMRCRKKQKIFGRRVQGSGPMCGHYCLYFLLAMARGDLSCMDKFGHHLNANDRLVRKEVLHHFRIP